MDQQQGQQKPPSQEAKAQQELSSEAEQHAPLAKVEDEESLKKKTNGEIIKTSVEEVALEESTQRQQKPAEDSLSEEWEPKKRMTRIVGDEDVGKDEEKLEKKEKEEWKEKAEEIVVRKPEDEEGKSSSSKKEEMMTMERKDCVKDDNGFTYYKCRFCGLTFNYMTTLKAHERVHDIAQPYTCNKCGEAFHFMCELEYHAKTHLAQKGYKCECGRTFFQYTDLLYHHHPGEDPPPEPAIPLPVAAPIHLTPSPSMPVLNPAADFPTPEFAEKGYEPKHQMRVWSDIRSKPYICQYCSKSYSDSRGLAYHMYSHRGERMFNPRASRYLMCRNDNSYISSGVDLRDA